MKRGLSSGRKTTLVFRGTYGTATHGGGSGSSQAIIKRVCVHHGCGCCLWCLVGRHRSLTAAVALDHHALWLWTQGRVARFKLWPLRRLLALETPLEKATAPPLVRDCSGGLSGYLGSSPLLWETQRELVPRPYLLALRRGEAARFKEQPALAAALRPSSD